MIETYKTPIRLGRTVDGRLVPYEAPEAAFLAYREGQEITMAEAVSAGLIKPFTGEIIGDVMERPDDAAPGIQIRDPEVYENGEVPEPCLEAGSGLLEDQEEAAKDAGAEDDENAGEDLEEKPVVDGIMTAEEGAAAESAEEPPKASGVSIPPRTRRAHSGPRAKK